jgi:hypothetical protein
MSEATSAPMLAGTRLIPLELTADGRVPERSVGDWDGHEDDKWFVIAPPQLRLHPNFVQIVLEHSKKRPDVELFYGDEVAQVGEKGLHDIVLKPDFDRTLLVADDYIGFPLTVRASAMRRLGLRIEARTAASFDLVLRASSAGCGISRISEVLGSYPGPRLQAEISDRRIALRHWVAVSLDQFEIGDGLTRSSLRLVRRFTSYPEVTIVIPTRQRVYPGLPDGLPNRPMIASLLSDISGTNWPMHKICVIVGDDLEDEAIYSCRCWPFQFRRIVTENAGDSQFNYAAKMNQLWRSANTEYIVMMNDDISIISPEWLRELLTFSVQEEVGVVGARLLYPNGTIQHAGMPGGLFGLTAHAWLGQPASAPTYRDWALVQREWSIMTGAVHATRKSLLEIVNGLDERFSLEFNDVDLCLRLRMLGYRNVYTPFAELVHYEKASRGGRSPSPSEIALFRGRWDEFLANDPAYHPRLTFDTYQVGPVQRSEEWWH